jgi:dihydroflavonol-4-reductase
MKKVLVTGISGYVGQHCAAELLNKGYRVKGSVRNLSKTDEVVKGLSGVKGSKENLEFCELNLLEDKGWDEAMEGCDFVLHVASPFFNNVPKDENKMIRPAVEGTMRALKAAKKAGIKRVVLTSSMVAMLGEANGSVDVDENSWTNTNAKYATPYLKSKTLAEKAAWEFINAQEGIEKLELVVINPGAVYGPSLTGNLSGESMAMVKNMILGKVPMLPFAAINISDVRDIAELHVAALTNDKAAGKRFIVASEKPHTFMELSEILRANGFEKSKSKQAPVFLIKLMSNFSSELRAMLPFVGNVINGNVESTKKTFNWKPLPLEKTMVETAKAIEAKLES